MEILLDSFLALFASIGIWTVFRMIFRRCFEENRTPETRLQEPLSDGSSAEAVNDWMKEEKECKKQTCANK